MPDIHLFHDGPMKNILAGEYQALLDFISTGEGYSYFLHTTGSEENAKSICQNGFRYYQFEKSTDQICDLITLRYMLNIRRHYGNYTIILQISQNIRDITTLSHEETDAEGISYFVLKREYVKGYFNRKTHQVIRNPYFRL